MHVCLLQAVYALSLMCTSRVYASSSLCVESYVHACMLLVVCALSHICTRVCFKQSVR